MAEALPSSMYTGSYTSFGGVDIRAIFNNVPIASLQGISWSITREKVPLYTMGDPDPRSFSRGKRGIAGSLIFLQFDRHALLGEMLKGQGGKFWSDRDSLRPSENHLGISAGQGSLNTPANPVFSQETNFGDLLNPGDDQEFVPAWLADQLWPFDVTLVGANEYGARTEMRILGLEILNEGSGVSIDDMVLEQQMTYVARQIFPWSAGEPGKP